MSFIDAGVKNDRNNGTGGTSFTDLTTNGSFIQVSGNYYEPYETGWIDYVKNHGVWEAKTTTDCYVRNSTSGSFPIRSRLNFITRPFACAGFSSVIADVYYKVHQSSVRVWFSVGMEMYFLNDGEDRGHEQGGSTGSVNSGQLTTTGMGDREGTYRLQLTIRDGMKSSYKWCIPMIYIRLSVNSGTDYANIYAGSGITGLWLVT